MNKVGKYSALAAIALVGVSMSESVKANCRVSYTGTVPNQVAQTVCWASGFDLGGIWGSSSNESDSYSYRYDESDYGDWYDDNDDWYDGEANSQNKKEQCAGNPILIGSGAKVEFVDDFIGVAKRPLIIKRKYDSRNDYDGAFGKGWHSNFDKRIEFNEYGKPQIKDGL
ncbi:MAG: hypothetical protein HRU22_05400, partial [Gammaproteobacteria bacterium]|nr:hypothetical protein [Gammaproteobacteria bacterium]